MYSVKVMRFYTLAFNTKTFCVWRCKVSLTAEAWWITRGCKSDSGLHMLPTAMVNGGRRGCALSCHPACVLKWKTWARKMCQEFSSWANSLALFTCVDVDFAHFSFYGLSVFAFHSFTSSTWVTYQRPFGSRF